MCNPAVGPHQNPPLLVSGARTSDLHDGEKLVSVVDKPSSLQCFAIATPEGPNHAPKHTR